MKSTRLAVAVLSLSLSSAALAQATAAAPKAAAPARSKHEQLALRLMELTGATQMGKQMMEAMLAQFSNDPSIPPGFLERFQRNAERSNLVDMLLPIYVKHLTRGELEAAIRFYETPAGKSMIAKMPVMMQESIQVGQQWGGQLAQQTMSEMEAAQQQQKPQPGAAPAPKKK